MIKIAQEERHADWVVMQNIARFEERFSAETEDGKYRILAQLLAEEFRRFESMPLF